MSENISIWEKMQSFDRRWLYLVLIVLVTFGLFVSPDIPAQPDESSVGLYVTLDGLDENDTILIQSDWTNSTRGETLGHLEALLRTVMAKRIKFVMYTFADPQAPQVSRDALRRLNDELPEDKRYKLGIDYLELGYFPNAEGATQSLGNNIRTFWEGRKTRVEGNGGDEMDIFRTPVLENIQKLEDCGMICVVTPSNTIDIAVERLSGKLPICCMCTGVVGPQILPYYNAGQVAGLAIGLKGVYDMEMMMAGGLNLDKADYPNSVRSDKYSENKALPVVSPIEGKSSADYSLGRGKKYYAALNIALALMVLAVIAGNIGMYAAKRRERNA
jgi:hypothetical protein